MITLDPRAGSGWLYAPLCRMKLPVRKAVVRFGDVSWYGNGPEGRIVSVGVEVKRLSDFIESMFSGRGVGHQYIGMANRFEDAWVLIIGTWRPDMRSGELQVPKGGGTWGAPRLGLRYSALLHYITTLEHAGLRVARVFSDLEATYWIASLYSWWTKKWEDHKGHLDFDQSSAPRMRFKQPGFLEHLAKEYPGIGWVKAHDAARRFCCPRELTAAGVEEWLTIPGVGKVIARRASDASKCPKGIH